MPDRTQKMQTAPDIFALMRADPPAAARRFTEDDQRLIEDEGGNFFTLSMIWCDCFVLPQKFARRRRALGDPAAAPRDHECGCDVSNNTFRPVCEKRRQGCKFERPPTCLREGVPHEPSKQRPTRRRYALEHALAAFLAYADAAPGGRRAMEIELARALSSGRARAFMNMLAAEADASSAPVSRSTDAPPSARNR